MHDNAFGPIGVAQFETFLREATNLRVLSVTNCGLGPEASTTIAEALIANENTKLTKLCMARSRVEPVGASALANYFNTYDPLEHLDVHQNGIKNDAIGALLESLVNHRNTLKFLDINDNTINTEQGKQAL